MNNERNWQLGSFPSGSSLARTPVFVDRPRGPTFYIDDPWNRRTIQIKVRHRLQTFFKGKVSWYALILDTRFSGDSEQFRLRVNYHSKNDKYCHRVEDRLKVSNYVLFIYLARYTKFRTNFSIASSNSYFPLRESRQRFHINYFLIHDNFALTTS